MESHDHGQHSLRRTQATLIDRQTKNPRAVQHLLGHTMDVRTRFAIMPARPSTRSPQGDECLPREAAPVPAPPSIAVVPADMAVLEPGLTKTHALTQGMMQELLTRRTPLACATNRLP